MAMKLTQVTIDLEGRVWQQGRKPVRVVPIGEPVIAVQSHRHRPAEIAYRLAPSNADAYSKARQEISLGQPPYVVLEVVSFQYYRLL